MALEYIRVQRPAKQCELVQCKETGDIWSVALVFDNGALIIGDTFNDYGDYEGIPMGPNAYWVLEKVEPGSRYRNKEKRYL